jgi:hypothetical protein
LEVKFHFLEVNSMPSSNAIRSGKAQVEVGADKSPLTRALRQARTELGQWTTNIAAIGTAAGAGLAAVGVAAVGVTKRFADYGSKIDDASQRTGVGAAALSELGYAAEQSGLGFDQLEGAIKKMEIGIGSGKTQKAIEALGLNFQQIQAMSPEDQFNALAESISQITDPAEQAAAAVSVFGKSGVDLLPMIKGGSAGLAALRDEAKALGVSLSQEDAAAAAAFGDAWDKVGTAVNGVAVSIGAALAPALTVAAEWIAKNIGAFAGWIKQMSIFVTSSEVAWSALKLGWASVSTTIRGVWDTASTAIAVAGTNAWAALESGFESTFQSIEQTAYSVVRVIADAFQQVMNFVQGYVTAISAAFPAIADQLTFITDATRAGFQGAEGLKTAVNVASTASAAASNRRQNTIEQNRAGAVGALNADMQARQAGRDQEMVAATTDFTNALVAAQAAADEQARKANEAAKKGTAIAAGTASGKKLESAAGTFTAAAARGLGAAGGFEAKLASAAERSARASEDLLDEVRNGALGLAAD